MPNGDDAAAAGMAVMDGTEDRKLGYDEINLTRDYIAQRTATVTPISKGGTGQTTVAAARNAFGLGNTAGALPIANGGTGADDAAEARAALGITPAAIGAAPTAHTHDWIDITGEPALVTLGYFNDRLAASGDQAIWSVYGRTHTVSTNYVSAYLNSDGLIAATPSALRFKQDIEPRVYTLAQLQLIGVVIYRLKTAVESLGDAAPYEVGVIAEQLIEAGLGEFVAYDAAGQTISVAYERLVLVAIGALQEVAGRLDNLETRLAALEGSTTA